MKELALILTAMMIGASVGAAPDIDVSIATAPENDEIVDGSFTAPVTPDVAWRVLTDYDRISDFISSLKESRVTERRGDELFVEQRFSGRFLFFSSTARVLLRIVEEPEDTIRFQDVSAGDFVRYSGLWTISGVASGCRVTYHLNALSRAKAPFSVKRRVLKANVADLLGQTRREMIRRRRRPGADTVKAASPIESPLLPKSP